MCAQSKPSKAHAGVFWRPPADTKRHAARNDRGTLKSTRSWRQGGGGGGHRGTAVANNNKLAAQHARTLESCSIATVACMANDFCSRRDILAYESSTLCRAAPRLARLRRDLKLFAQGDRRKHQLTVATATNAPSTMKTPDTSWSRGTADVN